MFSILNEAKVKYAIISTMQNYEELSMNWE